MSFKVREAHWQIMLEAMEKYSFLATGKFVGPRGRDLYKKHWDELAHNLNALGYGAKPTEKWQKTWSDLKYSLKKKGAAMRASLSRTGGGLDDVKPLSELELKILDLLGENFVGLNNPECGVPVSLEGHSCDNSLDEPVPVSLEGHSCDNSLDEPSTKIPATSTSKTMPQNDNMEPPHKRQKMDFHNEYKETIEELREIKNTLKSSLGEISSNLKDVASELKTFNTYLPQLLGGQVIFEESTTELE